MGNSDEALKKGNILVVEDDQSIRNTLKYILELEGFSVVLAENGKVGLEKLSKMTHPCLILLDLMMPVMNGWEFANNLKKNQVLLQIPIALVTAFDGDIGPLKNIPIIKKPIDLDLLLKMVNKYCVPNLPSPDHE